MAVSITQTANPAGVSASGNVASYSNVSIGSASADRIIVVLVGSEVTGATINSCTIDSGGGAQAMNAVTQGNQGVVYSRAFYLAVPSGTTATIAVTFGANPNNTQNHIAVYSITGGNYSSGGANNSTDMDATVPLTTGSTTIDVGGGMLAVAIGATDTNAKTWSNLTEDLDVDAGALRFTTASSITAGTATRTCQGTTNGEDGAMTWLIFTRNSLDVNVSDSSTATESITARPSILNINVSDSTTATESITVQRRQLNISVVDSSTATEAITVQRRQLNVSVSDSITAVDVPTVVETSVSDISTLIDNFNDNSIDGAKWTQYEPTYLISEESGQLWATVNGVTGDCWIYTNVNYNFVGSSVYVEVVDAGAQTANQYFDVFELANNADTDWIIWRIQNGSLVARLSSVGDLASTAYNSTTHRWLRIGESGGTTYWDYSADGVVWTNFHSRVNPFALTNNRIYVAIVAGSVSATNTVCKLDNFNYFPNVNVSDSSTIGESISISQTSNLVVSESSTVGEAVTVSLVSPSLPFNEYFEGGSLPASFDSKESAVNGDLAIDATSKVSGTYSVKVTRTGAGGTSLVKTLNSSVSEIYIKQQVFIPTAFTFTGTYMGFLETLTTGDVAVAWANLEDFGTLRLTLNNPSMGWVDTGIDISKNAIHTIQIYFKISATVGQWKVWVDTDVEGSPTAQGSGTLNTGTTNLQKIRTLDPYSDGAHGDLYFDNFQMDSAFITGGININVSDSSTVGESITTKGNIFLSVSDSSTVGENIATSGRIYLNVSDSSTITESLLFSGRTFLTIVDSTTITESLVFGGSIYLNVSDSSTITENITSSGRIYLSVSDSSNVVDALSFSGRNYLLVSETIIAVDVPTVRLAQLNIVVSDSTTIGESITSQSAIGLMIVDSTTAVDVVTVREPYYAVVVSDSTTAIDVPSLNKSPLSIFVSDSSTIGESISTSGRISLQVSDSSTVGESILAYIPIYSIIVSDSTTATESIVTSSVISLEVIDSTNAIDVPNLLIPILTIQVTDSVVIGEEIVIESVAYDLNISVSDTVNVGESIKVHRAKVKWYRPRNTVFLTERGTNWQNPNNINWQNENKPNWYNKLLDDWKLE